MIFDGRWKWELKKQSWAISLWQKAPSYGEYGKHKLNRAVLYSATVLRKAIEDEIEAEKVAKEQNWTLPECKIMSGVISATKYPYTDEDGWAFRGKICVSSYGEGQAASLKVKDVCIERLIFRHCFQVCFGITVQNQVCISKRVIVDQIIQL